MDKNIITDGYIDTSKAICYRCEHSAENNLDPDLLCGCRAFPNGIPREMLLANRHDKPVEGQIGDYVFKQAKHDYFQGIDI